MASKTVENEIAEIFVRVTGREVPAPEAIREHIRFWDSLTHADLLIEIEKHFEISFTLEEIRSLQSLAQIANCVRVKHVT